jgi:SGNH domain (fused to AT3 domains)
VLFGDSHAQQWDGALDSAAKQMHWKLVSWTKAACPVANVSIVNPQLKRQYSECDQWRAQTIAHINQLHPAVVIASQSDSVPGRALTNDHWAAETLSSLQSLSQPGTQVVFLADTPDPKGDVPSCVAANLSDVRKCDVSRAAAYHDSALYMGRHQLVVKTLQLANITVVDPIDWLCSKTECPVIVGNTLVYRDDSHLTNTYSTLLGPVLQPLLASPARAHPKGPVT